MRSPALAVPPLAQDLGRLRWADRWTTLRRQAVLLSLLPREVWLKRLPLWSSGRRRRAGNAATHLARGFRCLAQSESLGALPSMTHVGLYTILHANFAESARRTSTSTATAALLHAGGRCGCASATAEARGDVQRYSARSDLQCHSARSVLQCYSARSVLWRYSARSVQIALHAQNSSSCSNRSSEASQRRFSYA